MPHNKAFPLTASGDRNVGFFRYVRATPLRFVFGMGAGEPCATIQGRVPTPMEQLIVAITLHLYARQIDVTLSVPRYNIVSTWSNLLALNTNTTRIVSVGETPEMMQHRQPNDWAQHAGQLVFRTAFDPACFEPRLAEAFVRYTAAAIHHQLYPYFWSVWWSISRFSGTIHITDYERGALKSNVGETSIEQPLWVARPTSHWSGRGVPFGLTWRKIILVLACLGWTASRRVHVAPQLSRWAASHHEALYED